MQNRLSEYILDYKLASKFDVDFLKSEIFIPINEKELYINIAVVDNTINELKLTNTFNKPIKKIIFSKNEILQSLHLFDIKSKLYTISLENKESNIDDFLLYMVELALKLRSSDIHIESTLNVG